MSLCSQLIKLPRKVRARKFDELQNRQLVSQKCRVDFQNYFSDLMKMNNTDKETKPSSDENLEKTEVEILWQSELKGKTVQRHLLFFR